MDVRDLDAAASFALEHAHLGIRACEPAELVERIAMRKEQAVIAHGRQRAVGHAHIAIAPIVDQGRRYRWLARQSCRYFPT